MPIGVIVNALSILIGGIAGTIAGNKLTDGFKKKINMILGCCSMGMGISAIILMENMPAVVFSIIIGTTIGLVIRLGDRINTAAVGMNKIVEKIVKTPKSGVSHEEFTATLVTCIVLFCASGTGIYGAIGGKANQSGKVNSLTVGHGQSTGHARAHFAHIGVGRLPKGRGAGTEQFGGRGKLHMHFKANHGFIGGHRSNYSLSGVQPRNRAAKAPLCAYALARACSR